MTENVSAPVPYPDYEAAIGHPEFLRLIEKMLRAIAQSAKAGFAKLVTKAKAFLRYLDAKMIEGAEIHNRSRQALDERYAQNWHSIRGIL